MSPLNDRDPLNVLHGGDLPVQPDPQFAARLRLRLQSALELPPGSEGVTMSGTAQSLDNLTAAPPPVVPRPAALPYLAVADARGAISWYLDAMGAVLIGDPIVMDDNRIGHAELGFGGGVLYLADEYPELGLRAPTPGATSVSLMLPVAHTDAALALARDRGATVERETSENHGFRSATIVDPFGHRWMLTGPQTGVVSRIRQIRD